MLVGNVVTDPALAIEAAWAWLAGQGGGVMRTRGPGETWTIQTEINSQGMNVTWESDWGLLITVGATFNNHMISVTHDNCTIEGVHIDGNSAAQGIPNGWQMAGIRGFNVNNFNVIRCFVEDMVQYGVWVYGSSIHRGGEITGCIAEADWNCILVGSTIQAAASDIQNFRISNCYAYGAGDLCYCVASAHVNAENCIAYNANGTGSLNGQTFFGFEGSGTEYSSFNNCVGSGANKRVLAFHNYVHHCDAVNVRGSGSTSHGIFADTLATENTCTACRISEATGYHIDDLGDRNNYVGCDIYSETAVAGAGNRGYIRLMGLGAVVNSCRIWSETNQSTIYGVDINGSTENPCFGHTIKNCEIWGFGGTGSRGIRIRNNADYNYVLNSKFRDSTIGVLVDAVTELGNEVLGNEFDTVTEPLRDNGTGTVLAAIKGDFTYYGGGSAGEIAPVINTSPGGIDIDADNEFAYVRRILPIEVQQIVRIKIWGYSNVVEATNNMLLRIVAHGAGSSELWSGNAIDVPNKPSVEEGAIVQYDVLHWVFAVADDAQIGTLAAQDYVELIAVGEAAVAPDIGTDALFGGWEIEYV